MSTRQGAFQRTLLHFYLSLKQWSELMSGAFALATAQAIGNNDTTPLLDTTLQFLDILQKHVDTAEQLALISIEDAQLARETIADLKEATTLLKEVLPKESVGVVLDFLQIGLGLAGMIPVVGIVADVADLAVSGARRDWWGVGIGLAAAIPVAGLAAGGVAILLRKFPKLLDGLQTIRRLSEAGNTAVKAKWDQLFEVIGRLRQRLLGYTDDAAAGASRPIDEAFETTAQKLDDFPAPASSPKVAPSTTGRVPAGAGYDPHVVAGPNPNNLQMRVVDEPSTDVGVYLKPHDGKTKVGSTGGTNTYRTRYTLKNPEGGGPIEVEIPQTRFSKPAGVDDSAYEWTSARQRRFDEEYVDRVTPESVRYRAPTKPQPPVSQEKWDKFRHIFGYGDVRSEFGR